MEALFGHLYADDDEVNFSHDKLMIENMRKDGVEDLEPWRPYRNKKRRRSEYSSGSAGESADDDREREVSSTKQTVVAQAKLPEQKRGPLSPGEAALAWRKEVHDSALGAHGRRWRDVEMVSVAGHQTREVEM